MENKIIKGQFQKKFHIYELLILACAVFLIGLGVKLAAGDGNKDGIWFIVIGGAFALFSAIVFLLTAGHTLTFDGERLYVRCGINRLDCRVSDISVSSASAGVLTVVLTNGAIRMFSGLLNADEINGAISIRISDRAAEGDFESLKALYDANAAKRRKSVAAMVTSMLLMFIGVLAEVILVCTKNLSEMSDTEKIIVYIIGGSDILLVALTFLFAKGAGKRLGAVTESNHMLNRWVLCNRKPEKPYRKLYRMPDDMTRVVVYDGLSPNRVRFEVEIVDDKYQLHVIGVSPEMDIKDFDPEGLIEVKNG